MMMVRSQTCILVFTFAENAKNYLSASQSKILTGICFAIRIKMQFHQIKFFTIWFLGDMSEFFVGAIMLN